MPLLKEQKKKIISDFKIEKHDTGSTEVQIALLTNRINGLAGHFNDHVKDHHSRHGLIQMVSRRKRLLNYLHKTAPKKYQEIISRLELRK